MFEEDRFGKPKLSDRCGAGLALTFNLSHARGIVACAIAPGREVGVDIERADSTVDWSPVVERYFTRAEIVQLDQCPPPDRAARFAELWTLKEAHMKATGSGLSELMSSFGFDLNGERIRLEITLFFTRVRHPVIPGIREAGEERAAFSTVSARA